MSHQNIVNTAPSAGANIAAEQEEQWEGEGSSSRSSLMQFLYNPYLTLISRFVLGVVFLLFGLTKVGVPGAFATSINGYEMNLPSGLVTVMAVGLPLLEVAIGILLLVGLWTRLSAAIAGVLLVIFLIAMIQAMFRGLSPDCGCAAGVATANPIGQSIMNSLGPVGNYLANEKVGLGSVIRDLVFLLMSVHLIFVSHDIRTG